MYDKGLSGLGSLLGAGALSQIGVSLMWALLGGFALLAAGQAFSRTLPRQHA
jgi:hypothetical protein